MSAPATCPNGSSCIESCKTCMRVVYVFLGLAITACLLTASLLALKLVQGYDGTPDGKPAPAPTVTRDPSPTAEPTSGGEPTEGGESTSDPTEPHPTPTAPGGCNIFDPECSSGGATGGVGDPVG
ncbi:hypothetical protein [Streptomyces sp. CL12-4]|uniref:hypothetical protein n=1 Tax=Streptomyces sp. CL12-4 TaxID=2810306 RepID=UPI001EFB237F|nr:hypothetical protein [Streptomyces sp. CL12-4]MCG8971815.1 hypothetical protein [Streptomyces sp. CL12-4]